MEAYIQDRSAQHMEAHAAIATDYIIWTDTAGHACTMNEGLSAIQIVKTIS